MYLDSYYYLENVLVNLVRERERERRAGSDRGWKQQDESWLSPNRVTGN